MLLMIHRLIILLQIIACFTVAASAGPDKFRFTKEPSSQSIASGDSVSLTCIATGRTESAITYQWYKSAGVTIPPVDGDKVDATGHANGVGSVLIKTLTDGEAKLFFQCKATHGSEYILSNVSKVSFTFQGITFDKTSQNLTIDVAGGVIIYYVMTSLGCHDDIDTDLKSAAPVEIKWYKGTGSTAVSDDRMWVSPASADNIAVDLASLNNGIKKYSLVIYNVESGDAGDYECRAVSKDGTSNVIGKVALTVSDAPSIPNYIITEPLVGIRIEQLNSDNTLKTTPNVGDSVTLICGGIGMSNGDSTLTYKWESSGSTDSTTRFHVISSVAISDAITYKCTVTNSGGTSNSKELTLTVNGAVTTAVFGFTKVPDQYMWWVIGEANGDITFNCEGGDGTDASYTRNFYRNGAPYTQVGSDAKYTNAIKKSADSGAIQCAYSRSSNDMWLQQTTELMIVTKASAVFSTASQTIQDGSTASVTCTVGGYPVPHEVLVSPPVGNDITCPTTDSQSTTSNGVKCTRNSKTQYVLSVENFALANQGSYGCTAKNQFYKTDTTPTVYTSKVPTTTFVYVKNSVTRVAASSTKVNLGDGLTITCTVEGWPEPTVKLEKDGVAKTNNIVTTGTNTKVLTYTVASTAHTDSGTYKCLGSNTVNSVEQGSQAEIIVAVVENVRVTLSKTPSADEIAPGQALTLTCAAKAGPKPDYLLFKDSTNHIVEYNNAATAGVVVTDNGLSYTHTIASPALGDSTIYTCIAKNTDTDDTENTDSKTSEVIIVQAVVVQVSASGYAPQRGSTYVITCTAEGGRDPHSVVLTHASTTLKSYPTDDWCTGSYRRTCVYTISNIDYRAEGTYTCTAKNNASGNNEVTTSATGASVVVLKTVTITFAAAETEVDYGAQHTLTCTVEGGKAPHKVTLESPSDQMYTWEKNAGSDTLSCTGTNILSCTHTIAEALYSAGGDYSCTGWNKDDADTEVSAHKTTAVVIVKNAVATLTKTPLTLEVLHGSQLTINCTIEGGRRPDFLKLSSTASIIAEFDSDMSTVTSKTDNSVTYIHQTTAKYTDTSTYTCLGKNKAKGGVETEDSKTVQVIVVKPIVVSFESSLHNKTKGEPFALTCTARGYRQPHMMRLDKENGASLDLIKKWDINACTTTDDQTVQCTYTFASLDYSDKGRYKCTGQNKVVNEQVTTSTVETYVEVYQDVGVSFKDLASGIEVEVAIGASFTVTCLVDGGLPPHQVEIVTPKNGTKIWNNPSQSGDSLTCTGDNSLTCTVPVTASYDTSGIYTCTGHNKDVANALKTNSDNFTLTTVKNVSVILTKNPDEVKVFKGESVSFTCVAEGGRKPHELQFDQNETVKFKYPDSSTGIDTSGANNLTYTNTAITSADYSDSATYKCTSKNIAAGNASKVSLDTKVLTVVKNAAINLFDLSDSDIDYGQAVTFNFNVEGGDVPDVVQVSHSGSPIFDISTSGDKTKCSGTNVITCEHSIAKVDYSHDGNYILKVENLAKARVSTDATKTITIIKDVSVAITPASSTNIAYESPYTITCTLDGGMKPHEVEFKITATSGTQTKLWKRDDSSNNLACTGDHNVTCTYTFTPGYDSDGQYKCTGHNKVRSDAVRSAEGEVTLTTVRASTVLSITPDNTSALVTEAVTIVCTIAGKPQPANATVTWTHSGGYDISSNYTTVATGPYDLTSTLALTQLVTELSGVFTCKVGSSQMSTAEISIAQNNFLNTPTLLSNVTSSAVAIEVEEGDYIQLICKVEGFPEKTATLIVKNGEEEVIHEDKGKDKDDGDQSVDKIKGSFVWVRKVSCSDTIYLCRVTNTLLVITIDAEMSVIVDGCGIPMAIIGGAGGGAAALIIIVIVLVVLCIVRARKSNKGSFTPTSGAVIENGTYRSDTAPDPTYDHISQPVDADNGAYATFDDAKLKLKKPESEYAYATSTRLARPPPGFNGKNQYDQLQQQPINSPPSDNYAKLERDGTVPKGVISRYRPLNFDKGKQAPPQLPGNMPKEMSMKRNDDIEMDPMYAQIEKKQIEPDPMYAQLEMKPVKQKRGKQKMLQPDLPPDVPFYASRDEVQNEGLYASLDQGSKKKRGPPPPANDDLPPEVPIYSTRDEEDLYASVGPKASSSLRQPEPVYDDRPPDVPLYESRDEIEEESPYAAVEFKPKNGSTYRPYIPPDDATLYSTINEIQTSEEDHYVNARDVSRT